MKIVGVRELKDKLSSYIRAAQAGQRIVVTDRGRAVAELRPHELGSSDEVDPVLRDLIDRELLTLGSGTRPQLYPRLDPLLPAGALRDLLDETRGDH